MTWFDWTLATWLALGIVATIAYVGKPRKPITPGVAVATLLINGFLIGMVMTR